MDALLEAVEVEEVAFQAGCQASELRAILTSALASPQRKLAAMHSRIRKHLGTTAPKLAAQVSTSCLWMPSPICWSIVEQNFVPNGALSEFAWILANEWTILPEQ